jgi:hypothetical protein
LPRRWQSLSPSDVLGRLLEGSLERFEANAARSADHEMFPVCDLGVWAKHGLETVRAAKCLKSGGANHTAAKGGMMSSEHVGIGMLRDYFSLRTESLG